MTTAFARYGDTFGTVESGATLRLNDVSELLDRDRPGKRRRGDGADDQGDRRRHHRDRPDPASWRRRAGSGSCERVFTPGELAYAAGKHRQYQHLAARFAAKEAASKALATGWSGAFRWTDVEVINDPSGQPRIVLHGELARLLAGAAVTSRCPTRNLTSSPWWSSRRRSREEVPFTGRWCSGSASSSSSWSSSTDSS